MGKLVFVSGVLMALFVYFRDIMAGREEIILGARSWAALCASGAAVILGIFFWRK